jgi:demethylmenaquinone methyltransferase/2-methoxy-6-polyprenyl-1,4-benzoquinol methylase
MIEIARGKGVANAIVADALELPFDNGSFDAVTVAFGLRNMADWDRALTEMRRVLREHGHLLILDFSLPTGALRPAYRFYLHRCLPLLAGIVTGQKAVYDYLGGSIEKFPNGEAMLKLIEQNGFTDAIAEPLTGGIATIYTASKTSSRKKLQGSAV